MAYGMNDQRRAIKNAKELTAYVDRPDSMDDVERR